MWHHWWKSWWTVDRLILSMDSVYYQKTTFKIIYTQEKPECQKLNLFGGIYGGIPHCISLCWHVGESTPFWEWFMNGYRSRCGSVDAGRLKGGRRLCIKGRSWKSQHQGRLTTFTSMLCEHSTLKTRQLPKPRPGLSCAAEFIYFTIFILYVLASCFVFANWKTGLFFYFILKCTVGFKKWLKKMYHDILNFEFCLWSVFKGIYSMDLFFIPGMVSESQGKVEEKRAFWSNATSANTLFYSVWAASADQAWELRTGKIHQDLYTSKPKSFDLHNDHKVYSHRTVSVHIDGGNFWFTAHSTILP